jgi:DNA-binding SARP family transcriptional activator/tetratricopeptide (TPR) repeat protein
MAGSPPALYVYVIMYELRCFGRVELVDGNGVAVRSVLSQPKRIALLAFLAVEQGGSASRDHLVSLFWPDADPESGRHALSQALYFLRRSLGKRALPAQDADRVRIAPDFLRADVQLFQERLDAGDSAGALEFYAGPLLEGFSLPDHPEFDRWLDEARSLFQSRARDAAMAASEEAREAGDLAAACRHAEAAVRIAPLEERPLRSLLSSLALAGDRGRALSVYREFEERLQRELDVEPSRATRELVARIGLDTPAGSVERDGDRSQAPSPVPGSSTEEPDPRPRAASTGEGEGRAGAFDEATASSESSKEGSAQLRHPRRPVRTVLGLGPASLTGWGFAVILGLAIAFIGREGPSSEASTLATDASARVAVLPFSFQGSESYEYLGTGVAELLNISLGELRPLRMVDPLAVASALDSSRVPGPISVREADGIAERYEAEFYLTGSVIEFGGRIEIIVYLYRKGGELLASLRKHTTDETLLFQVMDDLVRELVAMEHLPAASWLGRTAAATTHSFPAFRSFLEGEDLYRRGDYEGAFQAMEAAVELDPSFALAHYRGALSALWMGSPDFDLPRQWIERGRAHASRLPEQEQLLISALDAFLGGRPTESERLYRQILIRQPENVEAWFNLGEVLFHYGPVMGRAPSESREAWERVLEVQPDHRGALFHLALTDVSEGRFHDLGAILERLAAVEPDQSPSLSVEALAAWGSRDRSAQLLVLERARHETDRAVGWAVEYLVRYLHEVPGALELSRTRAEEAASDSERARGHTRAALLELALGRLGNAGNEVAALEELDPAQGALLRTYMHALPEALLELRALESGGGLPLIVEDPPGARPVRDMTPRPVPPRDPRGAAALVPGAGRERPSGVDDDLGWYLWALTGGSGPGSSTRRPSLSEAVEALDALPPNEAPLSPLLAGALEAEAARRSQDRSVALQSFERLLTAPGTWYERTRLSPLYALARERFVLAELLREEGDGEAALRWYETLVRSSLGEAPLLGASWVRIGEVHEAGADSAAAWEAYRKAVELWSDADPEWDPVRSEIEARLPDGREGWLARLEALGLPERPPPELEQP